MNWQGDNLIGFWFNSIQFGKKNIELVYFSKKKKIRHRIDSLNSMYDHELPKFTMHWIKIMN